MIIHMLPLYYQVVPERPFGKLLVAIQKRKLNGIKSPSETDAISDLQRIKHPLNIYIDSGGLRFDMLQDSVLAHHKSV